MSNAANRGPCVFTIRYLPPGSGAPGYLGASVKYPPRPGETWERGNDLADGEATSATLQRIARDIEAVISGFANNFEMDRPT